MARPSTRGSVGNSRPKLPSSSPAGARCGGAGAAGGGAGEARDARERRELADELAFQLSRVGTLRHGAAEVGGDGLPAAGVVLPEDAMLVAGVPARCPGGAPPR